MINQDTYVFLGYSKLSDPNAFLARRLVERQEPEICLARYGNEPPVIKVQRISRLGICLVEMELLRS